MAVVTVVGGQQGCELRGNEGSVSDSLPNYTEQPVVSSSQQNYMLSRPRFVEQGYESVFQSPSSQDSYMKGGEQLSVNPQSEAWLNGYRNGLGVAANVFCWGCLRYGYVVPLIS